MNQAEKTLQSLTLTKGASGCYHLTTGEMDNNDLHGPLNDASTAFLMLGGQDVWEFSDGSYATRQEEDYYYGDDVDDFGGRP